MNKLNQKIIFHITIAIVGYFIFLFLNWHVFHLRYILLDFIQEIVTIPLFILQVPLFLFSATLWGMDRFKIRSYSFWSSIILLISISLTLIPFIIE